MTAPTFPDLDGKSVFITGGGSGIGASLTEAFLRQGAPTSFSSWEYAVVRTMRLRTLSG